MTDILRAINKLDMTKPKSKHRKRYTPRRTIICPHCGKRITRYVRKWGI